MQLSEACVVVTIKTLSELTPAERHHCRYVTNARLPGCDGLYAVALSPQGTLLALSRSDGHGRSLPLDRDALARTGSSNSGDSWLDVQGDWLSPGGIDIQINGALGLAFPDLDECHRAMLKKICRFLGHQGIDGFFPTLVTTAIANIHRALAVITAVQEEMAQQQEAGVARIWGVHLEGPCLNAEKRGAHPQEHLQPLTLEVVKKVLGDDGDRIKVITLAPELDPTGEVIPYLRSRGIVVSLGHSQGTAEASEAAFDQGATMVTHAFNAMPGLHHRRPGLLGAALTRSQVYCGVIADGQHICPTMLDMLMRVGRGDRQQGQAVDKSPKAAPYPQGLFLVSDALAPLGLPDGTYPWDTRQIHVMAGTARLEDGTLAGTTHGLLVGVQNLVTWNICDVGEAIALATVAPRQALGLPAFPVLSSSESRSGFSLDVQHSHWLRWTLQPESRILRWERL